MLQAWTLLLAQRTADDLLQMFVELDYVTLWHLVSLKLLLFLNRNLQEIWLGRLRHDFHHHLLC